MSGCRAQRGNACRVPDAGGRGCTTRQHKTHITDARELRYPWHPWAGHAVFIHGAVGKSDSRALHCSLDPSTTLRLIQIPQWMFDPAVSYEAQIREVPSVDAAVLLQLKSLLIGPRAARVLQAQHPSQDDAGESDVPFIEATAPSATAAVSSHPEAPALVGTTGGGSATDTTTARATAARRRARTSGRCSVRGAVR